MKEKREVHHLVKNDFVGKYSAIRKFYYKPHFSMDNRCFLERQSVLYRDLFNTICWYVCSHCGKIKNNLE